MPAPPPPDPAAEAAFRAEVARLRAEHRGRLFPLTVRVGSPGELHRRMEVPWPTPAAYDQGLRFDLVDALVACLVAGQPHTMPAWAWLTRPGSPEIHDVDLGWLAAAKRAFGAHGVPLAGFRAVTRTGWLDVAGGETRTWKRLRG